MIDPIPREVANWIPRGKEQNNGKQIKSIIPWLFLPVITKRKGKGADPGTVPCLHLPQRVRAMVAALWATTRGTKDAGTSANTSTIPKGSSPDGKWKWYQGCAKPRNY